MAVIWLYPRLEAVSSSAVKTVAAIIVMDVSGLHVDEADVD